MSLRTQTAGGGGGGWGEVLLSTLTVGQICFDFDQLVCVSKTRHNS